jgi:hypothetical protein
MDIPSASEAKTLKGVEPSMKTTIIEIEKMDLTALKSNDRPYIFAISPSFTKCRILPRNY